LTEVPAVPFMEEEKFLGSFPRNGPRDSRPN